MKFFSLVPTPATRSTYCAIQKGDMDIPMHGLQKPAPAPRAYKGNYNSLIRVIKNYLFLSSN